MSKLWSIQVILKIITKVFLVAVNKENTNFRYYNLIRSKI